MELIVEIGGRTERVQVEDHHDGRLVVTIGDRRHVIERQRVGNLHSLVDENGGQREISWRALGNDRWSIGTKDGSVVATVVDPLTHLAEAAAASSGSRRRQRVAAYMPGRVVSIAVEVGAEVVAGQGLMVLEAMKMQNEIVAEAAGVVSMIHVETGRTVESGDPLFDIE